MVTHCTKGHELRWYKRKGNGDKVYYYPVCDKCCKRYTEDIEKPRCKFCGKIKRTRYHKMTYQGKDTYVRTYSCTCDPSKADPLKVCARHKIPLLKYISKTKYTTKNGVEKVYENVAYVCRKCTNDANKLRKKKRPVETIKKERKKREIKTNPICEVHNEVKRIYKVKGRYYSKTEGKYKYFITNTYTCRSCENEDQRRRYSDGYRKPHLRQWQS